MNELQAKNNKVYLMGEAEDAPRFSHELYDEAFYDFKLKVERLSGQADVLPVTVSERLLEGMTVEKGTKLGIVGQFRSYNKMADEKSRLMLTVFVREFVAPESLDETPNYIEINGYVCKPPIYRTTPFDRKICDVLLAVNRGYNKSDYIPCIAWGRNAMFAKNLQVGSNLQVFGRVQSRIYNKRLTDNTTEERTAYELSISKLLKINPESEKEIASARIE
ncbi:MAG: single-stranded DNA-binding protein [Firmicutes bacterium]|mgnify:FL=1|nr:single-stranded DNA-binding protein [Bacillota bacterium]